MNTVVAPERATHTYRAKVTGRHAITLPADLCRRLNISVGDVVEFELLGNYASLRRVVESPPPPLRGLLRDYFKDREDIQRFLEEERQGWDERDARLEELWQRAQGRDDT